MRKMHELKIPDIIINAINEGGHAMDVQFVASDSVYNTARSWGKKNIFDLFINGTLVLIEFKASEDITSTLALGYVDASRLLNRIVSINIIGSLRAKDSDDNIRDVNNLFISLEDNITCEPYDKDDNFIEPNDDDTINIYKL